jgi:hypothetical protein
VRDYNGCAGQCGKASAVCLCSNLTCVVNVWVTCDYIVFCVPVCFHRSCGGAGMCGGGMRVARHANERPAEPWKARDMYVTGNFSRCDARIWYVR